MRCNKEFDLDSSFKCNYTKLSFCDWLSSLSIMSSVL